MPTEFIRIINDELCFTNVSDYSCVESEVFGWQITYDRQTREPDSETPIYFVLDSMNHVAFSHWVYENAIWIPEFQKLREKYPSCKLVLEEYRQYKKLFMDFYGISMENVCLHKDIQPENVCFFHSYISLNDLSIPSVYYEKIQEFEKKIETIHPTESIPLLYLPRGVKENLQGPNNRSYNVQEDLKEFVKKIGGTVYETDTTVSLMDQIRLVKSAHTIILDYGSNLWVNGFFSRKSKIVCMNIGWNHHTLFPSLRHIWEKIHRTSTVTLIYAHPSEQKTDSTIPVVYFHIPTVIYTLLSVLNISRNGN